MHFNLNLKQLQIKEMQAISTNNLRNTIDKKYRRKDSTLDSYFIGKAKHVYKI